MSRENSGRFVGGGCVKDEEAESARNHYRGICLGRVLRVSWTLRRCRGGILVPPKLVLRLV
jgi:hypothetical protein